MIISFMHITCFKEAEQNNYHSPSPQRDLDRKLQMAIPQHHHLLQKPKEWIRNWQEPAHKREGEMEIIPLGL